jgi:hypothetical protein
MTRSIRVGTDVKGAMNGREGNAIPLFHAQRTRSGKSNIPWPNGCARIDGGGYVPNFHVLLTIKSFLNNVSVILEIGIVCKIWPQSLSAFDPSGITMTALKIFIHLSPLIPVYFGRYYLALALVLAVVIIYVKCHKIRAEVDRMQDVGEASQRELAELQKLLRRWESFSFERLRKLS